MRGFSVVVNGTVLQIYRLSTDRADRFFHACAKDGMYAGHGDTINSYCRMKSANTRQTMVLIEYSYP
jgi:hypothetical protein